MLSAASLSTSNVPSPTTASKRTNLSLSRNFSPFPLFAHFHLLQLIMFPDQKFPPFRPSPEPPRRRTFNKTKPRTARFSLSLLPAAFRVRKHGRKSMQPGQATSYLAQHEQELGTSCLHGAQSLQAMTQVSGRKKHTSRRFKIGVPTDKKNCRSPAWKMLYRNTGHKIEETPAAHGSNTQATCHWTQLLEGLVILDKFIRKTSKSYVQPPVDNPTTGT